MGQALRRATNRLGGNGTSTTLSESPSSRPPQQPKVELKPKITINQAQPPPHLDQDNVSNTNLGNVLEAKDQGYDAMLSQMVGRIKTKPGGKLEMGEAFIVEKYDRPMPKLRNTKAEINYEEKPAPPGTLNVPRLREMLRLHQGKTNGSSGPMDANQISKKFQIEITQVQKILQYVSLPPQDRSSKQQNK